MEAFARPEYIYSLNKVCCEERQGDEGGKFSENPSLKENGNFFYVVKNKQFVLWGPYLER